MYQPQVSFNLMQSCQVHNSRLPSRSTALKVIKDSLERDFLS
jgi:hypothetical protein